MELWAWRPEAKLGDSHHHAELEIVKPEAEPESCTELPEMVEPRS